MPASFPATRVDREHGFTLIELLVVMIIIGILAAIAIPLFLSQKKKAHETAAKSDATSIAHEVETMLVDGNPASLSAGALPAVGPALVTLTATTGTSSDTSGVKVGPGDSLTKLDYDATTGAFCVEVTPVDTTASPWNARPDGIYKGTCP